MLEELFTDSVRTLCAESRVDRPDPPYAPLFFYHVPKTGGLSFYVALRSTIQFANKYEDRLGALGSETLVHRFDDAVPHRRLFQTGYAFLASHQAFGFHGKFRQRFLLTTMIRDPLGRVRSEYTYGSMRRQQPVTAEGFQACYRDEANVNRAVKQLAGQVRHDLPAPPDLWLSARQTLEGSFHAYVPHTEIGRLLSFYLSYYRLPNMVMDRINATSPAYRLDAGPFRDEIESLNRQDQKLFEFVRDHPRLPTLELDSPRCHPTTLIINETATVAETQQAEVLTIGVDTAQLAQLIRENRGWASGLVIPVDAARCVPA